MNPLPQTVAARLKKVSPLRPTLAIVLGSGFQHALTELRVAGISCITNLAAGISKESLSHAEVLKTAERVKKSGSQLIKNFAELYEKI